MYMIEITEDKVDNVIEHISKGLKCMNKALDCMESLKEHNHKEFDDEEDEEDDYSRHKEKRNKSRYSRY